MAGTQVRMDRSTIVVNGTNKYQITASCILKGTLPDVYIFLLNINDVVDPKNDTLARVIDVADITSYLDDRDDAIANADTLFRSYSVTLVFDNIDTANAAQKELKSRINTLVNNVDTFLDEFETANRGEVVVYPTVDPSEKQARIDVYEASEAPVTAAEEARDEHIVECNALETELGYLDLRISDAQTDYNALSPIQATIAASSIVYGSVYSTIGAERTLIRNYNSTSSATPAEQANIEAQLVGMDAQLTAFGTNNTQLSAANAQLLSAVSSVQARLTTLNAERTTLVSDLNKCNLKAIELQAAVDAARAARNTALAAVLEVCPDYVP